MPTPGTLFPEQVQGGPAPVQAAPMGGGFGWLPNPGALAMQLLADPEIGRLQKRLLECQVIQAERALGLPHDGGCLDPEELWERPAHAVIMGTTGSGKTVTAQWLLQSAAETGLTLYKAGNGDDDLVLDPAPPPDRLGECVLYFPEASTALFAERARKKPSRLFSEILALHRHKRIWIVTTAQSSAQIPREMLAVDAPVYLGWKRQGLLARAFVREEMKELSQSAQALLNTLPDDPGFTAWVTPRGFTTWSFNRDLLAEAA